MTEQPLKTAEDLRRLKPARAPLTESQLGALLVTAGIIDRAELRNIIEKKLQSGKSFLETMAHLGYLHNANEPAVLASRLGIPLTRVAAMEVDGEALESFPRELMLRYEAFPLGFLDSKLVIAMANPCNLEAIQTISFASEHVIEIVMAPLEDIKLLMERYLFTSAENEILSELDASLLNDFPATPTNTEALRETALQKPVVRFVDNLLHKAVAVGASDITIRPTETGGDVYYRIDGKMLYQRNLDPRQLSPIVCRIKIMSGMNIAERRLPQDGHTVIEDEDMIVGEYIKEEAYRDTGGFTAPFEGIHGWYYKNRSAEPVAIRIEFEGFFEIVPPGAPGNEAGILPAQN